MDTCNLDTAPNQTVTAIVKVDKRPYRKIAQENWGLTDDQMRGKHVHHRIHVSDGGTNDPSNLYVCSPSMHRWGWHDGEEWIEWANKGGRLGGSKGGLKGGRTNAESGHCARIAHLGGLSGGKKGGTTTKRRKAGIFNPGYVNLGGVYERTEYHRECCRTSRSAEERAEVTKKMWEDEDYALKMKEVARKNGIKMFEEKKGVFDPDNLGKGAKTTNSQKWIDPEHPELGAHHFNVLKKKQREKGYPNSKENRVKLEDWGGS